MSVRTKAFFDSAFDDPAFFATLVGTPGDDHLEGTLANDVIYGGDGNDKLGGRGGDDFLYGDGGNDYLYGGQGADSLFGGDGNDRLEGGAGNDRIDTGGGFDVAFGGIGNDILFGNSGEVTLFGGDGNDTLTALPSGFDTMFGGNGDDTIVIAPNFFAGVPILVGSRGVFDGGSDNGGPLGDTLSVIAGTTPGTPGQFQVNFYSADEGNPNVMTGIEHIQLGATPMNLPGFFTLDAHDVHQASQTSDQLVIDGHFAWTVAFTNNPANPFELMGTTTIGSQTYSVYSDGTAKLLIDLDLDITGL